MKRTKKLIATILCFVLVASLSATAYAEELPEDLINTEEIEEPVYITGYVKVNGATLRREPSTDSDGLSWLPLNTTFLLNGTVVLESGETWYLVHVTSGSFVNRDGYLRKDMVTIN